MLTPSDSDSGMPLMQRAVCGRCDPRTALAVHGLLLACPRCGDALGAPAASACVVLGPSGSGKSAVARRLRRLAADERARVAVLDADTLLHRLSAGADAWLNDWLLLAASIGASGVAPVLLLPGDRRDVEAQPARAQLAAVRWAVLACAAPERAARLEARPSWRGWEWQAREEEARRPPPPSGPDETWIDTSAADVDTVARALLALATAPEKDPG